MATPAARAPAPRPPDKGVFPLDHFNECKEARPQNESSRSNELEMTKYMACLKEQKNSAEPCRVFSKVYLECRMSKGLMAQEDLRALGFRAFIKDGGKGAAEGAKLTGEDSKQR